MSELKFGPIGANAIHLCVDMQRMFDEETPWRTPWMGRILPRVVDLCRHNPGRTIFTRFVPADRPGDGGGPLPADFIVARSRRKRSFASSSDRQKKARAVGVIASIRGDAARQFKHSKGTCDMSPEASRRCSNNQIA